MVLKQYKHFNSGNTFRKCYNTNKHKSISHFKVKRYGTANTQIDDVKDLKDFDSDLTYSQNKRKRWELPHECRKIDYWKEEEDDDKFHSLTIIEERETLRKVSNGSPVCVRLTTNQAKHQNDYEKKSGHAFLNSRSLIKEAMNEKQMLTDGRHFNTEKEDLISRDHSVTHVTFTSPEEGCSLVHTYMINRGTYDYRKEHRFDKQKHQHYPLHDERLHTMDDIDDEDDEDDDIVQQAITESLSSHPDTAQYFKSSSEPHFQLNLSEALSPQKPNQRGKKVKRQLHRSRNRSRNADDWCELWKYPETEEEKFEAAATAVMKDDVIKIIDRFPVCRQFVSIRFNDGELDQLSEKFGDSYEESLSLPRRFLIDLTIELTKRWEIWTPVKHLACLVFEEQGTRCSAVDQTFLYNIILNLCLHEDTSRVEFVIDTSTNHSSSSTLDEIIDNSLNHITTVYSKDSFALNNCIRIDATILQEQLEYHPLNRKLLVPTTTSTSCMETIIPMLNNEDEFVIVPFQHKSSFTFDVVQDENCDICYQSLIVEDPEVGNDDLSIISWCGVFIHPCNHKFCRGCITEHLLRTLRIRRTGALICPGHACDSVIDFTTCVSFVSLSEVTKYQKFKRMEIIHCCPNTSCQRRFVYTKQLTSGNTTVKCSCLFSFCLLCKEEDHWPLDCDSAKIYRQQLLSNPDTSFMFRFSTLSDYPIVFGRYCPHCGIFITKGSGCPVMTCRCGKTFCWLCGKVWYKFIRCCSLKMKTLTSRRLVDVNHKWNETSERAKDEFYQAITLRKQTIWNKTTKENYLKIVKTFCDFLIKDKKALSRIEVENYLKKAELIVATLYEIRRIGEYMFVKSSLLDSEDASVSRHCRELANRLTLLNGSITHLVDHPHSHQIHKDPTSHRLKLIEEKFLDCRHIVNQIDRLCNKSNHLY